MRYIRLVWTMIVVLCLSVTPVLASRPYLHGEIVEVFPEQNKVRILVDGKLNILKLEDQVEIFRQGEKTCLESARPITDNRYQEGLFFVNEQGKVFMMIVDYSFNAIETPSGTVIIYYNVFGEVKDVEQFPSLEKGSLHI